MEQIIETDTSGALTLPPELLGDIKPHAQYVVQSRGEELVLRPTASRSESGTERKQPSLSAAEWWQEWETWSEQVTQAWNTNQSAAEVLAEMRR